VSLSLLNRTLLGLTQVAPVSGAFQAQTKLLSLIHGTTGKNGRYPAAWPWRRHPKAWRLDGSNLCDTAHHVVTTSSRQRFAFNVFSNDLFRRAARLGYSFQRRQGISRNVEILLVDQQEYTGYQLGRTLVSAGLLTKYGDR